MVRFLSGKEMFDNSPAGMCGRAALFITFLLFVFLLRYLFLPDKIGPYPHDLSSYPVLMADSSEQLKIILKKEKLWDIEADAAIKPLILKSFPKDLRQQDIDTRKKLFLHSLLPAILLAEKETEWEKRALDLVCLRLGRVWADEPFLRDNIYWQAEFSKSEVEFILNLTKKYRTADPEELARRIDTLPVSLVLAQGALESSWGTSRFAQEGNSVFGVWTWGDNGIIPDRRDTGKTHRVAHYKSLLDSVRAYLLNLNRMEFYKKLRQLRQNSDDSIILSSGLLYYSTRRHDYVKDVRLVIDHNGLKEYDGCMLDD